MDNNQLKIRKIHLNTFIDVLVELYDKGVDYVDLSASLNELQDVVAISFCKEYMNEEYRKDFDNIPETGIVNKKLSDDDLNQLI